MEFLQQWRSLTPDQKKAFLAAYLGWMLDAFDYFLLVFVIKDVAAEFHTDKTAVATALTLTLACRPIGALLFGMAGDRYGRRLPLMLDVLLYSFLEVLTGFAPNLRAFLVLRALFGVAMGGEWGLGASLALESAPAAARGVLSGVLQQGYPAGYLLGAILYRFVLPGLGWRWLFFIGGAPALLSLFIRSQVKESAVWQRGREERVRLQIGPAIRRHAGRFGYLVLLMTAFNLMSHGTQDIYPTFLQIQHRFRPEIVSNIAIVYNIGALIGGILVGGFSQRIGRRRAIVFSALLALPVIPLWAFSRTAPLLALGAFLMQFLVQGAWGVIPAHLTELSPDELRGTFTGFAYQLGNLFAAYNARLQTELAESRHNNYGLALASVIAVALTAVAVVTALGPEERGVAFGSRGQARFVPPHS